MNNPKEKLKEYLDQIFHRFLNLKSLFYELKRINSWYTPEREEAINHGSYFFQLTTYSMTRIYLVELAALLSDKEDRSLIDWLEKASVHAKGLCPIGHRLHLGCFPHWRLGVIVEYQYLPVVYLQT